MSQLTTLFTDIADSLRAKEGSSGQIPAIDFPERIDGLAGKMQIVDESGEQYKITRMVPFLFNAESVLRSELSSYDGTDIAASGNKVFCVCETDDYNLRVFSLNKDGDQLGTGYISNSYGCNRIICHDDIAVVQASGRSSTNERTVIVNNNSTKTIDNTVGLSMGIDGFWTLNRDTGALEKYNYSTSGTKIQSITASTGSTTSDVFVDEKNSTYNFLIRTVAVSGSSLLNYTIRKYSFDGALVSSLDLGNDYDAMYLCLLENGDFVIDGKVYSAEFEYKFTVTSSRYPDNYISVAGYDSIFLYDSDYCIKELIFQNRGVPVWIYKKGGNNCMFACDEDYVYLMEVTTDKTMFEKVPMSNTNDYVITTEKNIGGGYNNLTVLPTSYRWEVAA